MIVIVGDSASGKDTLAKMLTTYGMEQAVTVKTRKPRHGEVEGIDGYFVTIAEFNSMVRQGLIAEYEEYSQCRFYGSLRSSYSASNGLIVLTPNGFRALKRNGVTDVFAVYLKASLGTRMIRYIERCGIKEFNFDDKNEIAARVERDFGMFLGIENEVDLVLNGDESTKDIARQLMQIYPEHLRRKKEKEGK